MKRSKSPFLVVLGELLGRDEEGLGDESHLFSNNALAANSFYLVPFVEGQQATNLIFVRLVTHMIIRAVVCL